ncbi:hypothetical protein ACO1O0_007495 [Amphichorda felina]
MSSSNPFRKKGPAPPEASRFPAVEDIDTSVAQAPRPPPLVSFRRGPKDDGQVGNDGDVSDAPAAAPPAPGKKAKVVKKVRVLSPPPLSPDSPEWPSNPVPAAAFPEDPFSNGVGDAFGANRGTPPPPTLQQQQHHQQQQLQQQQEEYTPGAGPPPNPFSKTLQDLENSKKEQELKDERKEEGAALKAVNIRGSMNVDSFRRLLMTGNTGNGSSGVAGQEGLAGPGVLGVDAAHGGARVLSGEHRNQNTEDEGDASDSSTAVQFGQRKKAPPPPPSSRHGKSIADHARPRDASGNSLPMSSSHVGTEGDAEPHHAGDSTTSQPQDPNREPLASTRKSAPAPPPRRGHARTESKIHGSVPPPQRATRDESPAPSPSPEAAPTRTNSFRHSTYAPAPPPRRRPHVANRISMTSPISGTFHTSYQSPQEWERSAGSTPSHEAPASFEPSAVQDPYTGHIKLSAPPPPPARNASTRRPPSVSSVEAPVRKVSGESSRTREGLPPPPPPSRKRGSSKSSMDGQQQQQQQQPSSTPLVTGQGDSILADLDALQREVDALRGKMC